MAPDSPASVTPSFNIDEYFDSENLAKFASYQNWLDGSQPFMVDYRIEHSIAAQEVLPEDAVIERTVRDNTVFALTARCADATIWLETGISYAKVRVTSAVRDRADAIVAEITARSEAALDDKIPVRVWSNRRGGSYDDHRLDSPHWSSIEGNYPPKVREQLQSLMKFNAGETHFPRLILWHGEPGTGKTTAIRALAREWNDWCATQYVTDPEQLFTQSEYMDNVLEEPAREAKGPTFTSSSKPDTTWRLLIAEDTDEFLRSNTGREANAALARLLNLSDGIFGQNHRLMLLLTTNEDVNRLHPALIRPGRCLANIDFARFTTAEARKWLDGKGKTPSRPATLAQLLVRRGDIASTTTSDEQSLPIGAYL